MERTSGRGYDIVLDCTGVAAVIQDTFLYAGPNARIMFFGVASPTAQITIQPFAVYHHTGRSWAPWPSTELKTLIAPDRQ